MKFPNAASGSKKLFTAEILTLFAAIISGIAVILMALGGANAVATGLTEGTVTGGAVASMATGGILMIIAPVFTIIALILMIVGLVQCAKDENAFKVVLFAYLIVLILNIISAIFSTNRVVTGIAQVANAVIEIFTTIFIITGFCNLADQLNNAGVKQHGQSLMKLILIVIIIEVVLKIVVNFAATAFTATVGGILGVVLLVLSVIQYIAFLSFLAKSKNMLNS